MPDAHPTEQRDGRFERQQSKFRGWTDALDPARHHLYVCLACPWAHRTVIVRRLRGLEDVLPMSCVDPIRDDRGWAFTGGPFTDPLHGWSLLSEAYPGDFEGRVTVPVLWDEAEGRIVNNESADVIRILDASGRSGEPLDPPELRDARAPIDERIYETLNNGVYRCGFARTQEAYEEAFEPLFETLDWLEQRLGEHRWLAGDRFTLSDVRLFTTLLRFDAVYVGHFKCNRNRIVDLPNVWAYARSVYQLDGIAETCDLDQIKRHYYVTHPSINPTRIVPAGPRVDWDEPHGR